MFLQHATAMIEIVTAAAAAVMWSIMAVKGLTSIRLQRLEIAERLSRASKQPADSSASLTADHAVEAPVSRIAMMARVAWVLLWFCISAGAVAALVWGVLAGQDAPLTSRGAAKLALLVVLALTPPPKP